MTTLLTEHARALAEDGLDEAQIIRELVGRGHSEAEARRAATARWEQVEREDAEAQRSDATAGIMVGLALAGFGVLVTVVTYASASSGGGKYVIAYGAIISGLVKVFRSLSAS